MDLWVNAKRSCYAMKSRALNIVTQVLRRMIMELNSKEFFIGDYFIAPNTVRRGPFL